MNQAVQVVDTTGDFLKGLTTENLCELEKHYFDTDLITQVFKQSQNLYSIGTALKISIWAN